MITFPPEYYGPDAPGWHEIVYITDDGNYHVATYKYKSIKADDYCFLLPGGEPKGYYEQSPAITGPGQPTMIELADMVAEAYPDELELLKLPITYKLYRRLVDEQWITGAYVDALRIIHEPIEV